LATKPLLTEEESDRVAQAVAAAEKKTGGEIATAIIAESDDYGFRELVFAIIVGVVVWTVTLGFPGPLEALLNRLFWSWEPWLLSGLQGVLGMVGGLIAYLVAQIPAVDRLIVPKAIMREAVTRRARRHFVDSGTYDTVDNTGVLIFISLLERRVELIADRGIHQQVEPDTWNGIVTSLTQGIHDGRTADALVEAVTACGDVLEGRVQRRPDDTNELANRPEELEKGS
jgi:putative membrane protein